MTVKHGFKGERPYISTFRGERFYLDKPVFDAVEIGHALGNLCRYGGQCLRFYSVAEHSLLVAMLCEQLGLADPFEGLMHDAHEAYLQDMPKPWKAALPDYSAIEHKLEAAMRQQYRLAPTISQGCKTADWIALAIESRVLLPSKGDDFAWPQGIREQANKLMDLQLNYWHPAIARDHFMVTFAELSGPRGFHR